MLDILRRRARRIMLALVPPLRARLEQVKADIEALRAAA